MPDFTQNRKTESYTKWFENATDFPELSTRSPDNNRIGNTTEPVDEDKWSKMNDVRVQSYVKVAEKKVDHHESQLPQPEKYHKVENWSKVKDSKRKPVDGLNSKKTTAQQPKLTKHQDKGEVIDTGYSDDDQFDSGALYQMHKSERSHTLQTNDIKRAEHQTPFIDTRQMLRRRQRSKD
jgi:hypothetical protein